MFLASTLDDIALLDAGVVALLGYALVFFGLILLMAVIAIIGRAFSVKTAKSASAIAPAPVAAPAPAPSAPGVAGELKLHDVEPKTAAMLMAIVADKMGKPLNELRFISIKEVK